MKSYFIKFVSTPMIMVALAGLSTEGTIYAQITDGTINSFQKISATAGNFTAILDNVDLFGGSLTILGGSTAGVSGSGNLITFTFMCDATGSGDILLLNLSAITDAALQTTMLPAQQRVGALVEVGP